MSPFPIFDSKLDPDTMITLGDAHDGTIRVSLPEILCFARDRQKASDMNSKVATAKEARKNGRWMRITIVTFCWTTVFARIHCAQSQRAAITDFLENNIFGM